MSINTLRNAVQRQITASSAVDSTVGAIKELIDNSIDARATSITVEIDAQTAGLSWISVADDGVGINKEDVNKVCLNGTTSKLTDYEELKTVKTMGFRGEALNALAHLSNGGVSIISKQESDPFGYSWTVDLNGHVNSSLRKLAVKTGTTVNVQGFYSKYPVRKKVFSTKVPLIQSNIEELIDKYSLVYQKLRFELRRVQVVNGKVQKTWKSTVRLPKQSRARLLSNGASSDGLDFIEGDLTIDSTDTSVHYVLPIPTTKTNPLSTNPPKLTTTKVLSVNDHPLNVSLSLGKIIKSLIREIYDESNLDQPQSWYLDFKVLGYVDFNIEPKKDDCIVPLNLKLLKDQLMANISAHLNLGNTSNVTALSTELPQPTSVRVGQPHARITPVTHTSLIHHESNFGAQKEDHTTSSIAMCSTVDYTEEDDDWSHAMHDKLSSELDTSQPNLDIPVILDEDVDLSKNLELSNPFTLTKLATSKNHTKQANLINGHKSPSMTPRAEESLEITIVQDSSTPYRSTLTKKRKSTTSSTTSKRASRSTASTPARSSVKTSIIPESTISPKLIQSTLNQAIYVPRSIATNTSTVELENLPIKQFLKPNTIKTYPKIKPDRNSATDVQDIHCFTTLVKFQLRDLIGWSEDEDIVKREDSTGTAINKRIIEFYEDIKGSEVAILKKDGLFYLQ